MHEEKFRVGKRCNQMHFLNTNHRKYELQNHEFSTYLKVAYRQGIATTLTQTLANIFRWKHVETKIMQSLS